MNTTQAPRVPFRHSVRVYWEDTDAGGVVFYANYLKFFERARTEWLRSLGFGQQQLRADCGGIFIVGSTALKYRSPARLDDVLDITVQPTRIGQVSLDVAQQAFCGEALLAEGSIRVGFVNEQTFKPQRMPDAVLRTLVP